MTEPASGEDVTIEITAPMSASSTLTASVAVWDPWGLGYLASARYFANNAASLERQIIAAGTPGDLFHPHRANVTAAVNHSVAYLEAVASTVGASIRDGKRPYSPARIPQPDLDRIRGIDKETWKRIDRGLSTLQQMQLLAQFSPEGKVDTDREPHSGARLLVSIRNSLTHFDPETVELGDEPHRMEVRCQGRFEAFALGGSPWWPNGLLGAGLAQWSVKTVETYMAEWCRRVGLDFNLDDGRVAADGAAENHDSGHAAIIEPEVASDE